MSESQNILEVKDLTKFYGSEKAVDGISFSVNAGEIVGLLGPNGAGKTTTVDMILGLLEPDFGSIKIFGKELKAHRSGLLRRVNFTAAYSQLPSNLSVMQNLRVFAKLYNIPEAKERIWALMREFDLEKFARTRTGFLSSGEQSRLNLAKAFLNSPSLLLFDEPTASIDPATSETVRSKILRYAKERQAAVLWTSHDMYEVETVCHRVLFISHGKIFLEGNPEELPRQHGKKNLEELFIAIAREPLSISG